MARFRNCTRIVAFNAMAIFGLAAYVEAGELAFQLSPQTGMHIALQPRADHHRIHFLVRTTNLAGGGCVARLICRTDDSQTATSEVEFYPRNNLEVFAIYLRIPKVMRQSAYYMLFVDEVRNDDDTSDRASLSYYWRIVRDSSGTPTFEHPQPGETVEVVKPIRKVVPETNLQGEIIQWKIVWEERSWIVQVPADFRFGIDTTNNARDAFDFARPIR